MPRSIRPIRRSVIVLLSLSACAEPAQTSLDFEQVVIDATGIAYQRDVGDLDGDGWDDVVGNTLSQLYWFRYPDWQRNELLQLDEGVHGYPFFRVDDLKLADIDEDGDLDVITRIGHNDELTGRVIWLENPRPTGGVGGTWVMHEIGLNSYVKDLAVKDFDGDGRLDVVTRESERTQIWFQDEPDSWVAKQIDHVSHEGMDVGDLDGDNDPDIVLNGFWFETPPNPRTGTYTQHTIDSKWYSGQTDGQLWQRNNCKVDVADIDGDGRLDVVLSHSELPGYPVSWYSATDPANGSWTERVIVPQCDYCHNLEAADFNNDGRMDVLAGGMIQSQQRGLTIYLGDGTGGDWTTYIVQQLGSYSAELGDIDNDLDVDIVTIRQWNEAPTEIWRNKLRAPVSLDDWTYIEVDDHRAKWGDFDDPDWLRYFGLGWGDVDRDGFVDLVSGRYFYRNPGGDMTGAWQRVDFGFNVDALFVVDVDGDVFGDVIGVRGSTVYWLEAGNTEGSGWTPHTIDTTAPSTSYVNPQGYAVADVVPGGKPEILISNSDKVFYYRIPTENPESGNWPRTEILDESNGGGIGVADFDADGYLDVSVVHYPTGSGSTGPRDIKWAKNPGDGSGNWTEYVIGSHPGDFLDRVAAADLNGDDRPDIIVTEEGQPAQPDFSTYWYEAPADPAQGDWTRHLLVTQHTTNSMDVADMDRDGDVDIILGEHRSGTDAEKVTIWANDGGGDFIEHIVDQGRESHLGARVVDLDGDLDREIVSIAWDEYAYLHLWRNDGRGGDNAPPTVDAGVDQVVWLQDPVALYGEVTDDGLPDPPGTVTLTWSQVSGPGSAVFTDTTVEHTTVVFGAVGPYLLRLEADDGEFISTDDVTVFAFLPVQRITDGLTALYLFDEHEGATVHDTSSVGAPMNLTIADPSHVTWGDGTLSVDIPTVISSGGPAAKLYTAVSDTGEITIEAWLTPANVTQDGPARVVTMSLDSSRRNFTLGQGRWNPEPPDVVDVRLRTTATSENGVPSVTTPAGSVTAEPTHVVYTRAADGLAKIYVNNVEWAGETIGGNPSNWDSEYAFALANELTGDRPWLGKFHIVAVYNRALSLPEVNQNYVAGPAFNDMAIDPDAIPTISDWGSLALILLILMTGTIVLIRRWPARA